MKIEETFFPGTELDLYYNGNQIPIIINEVGFCSKEIGDNSIYCESKMKNIENFNSIIENANSFYSNFDLTTTITTSSNNSLKKGYFLVDNKKINCYIEGINYFPGGIEYNNDGGMSNGGIAFPSVSSSIQECDISFYISLKEIEEEKNKNIPFTRFEIMDI